MQHVLLVEDDVSLAQWVKDYLESKDYQVTLCLQGDLAIEKVQQLKPDILLLDGMLPGMDGFDICRQVRGDFNGPILMLTARDEEIDEVLGLEIGADDYLTKPVKPRVLLARMKAATRRASTETYSDSADTIRVGSLMLTFSNRHVQLAGEPVKLSSKEFDLLWLLAKQAGDVVTRQQLYSSLRGFEYDGFDRSIDLRVSRLRKKLGDDSANPYRIKTIWSQGYLLTKDAW